MKIVSNDAYDKFSNVNHQLLIRPCVLSKDEFKKEWIFGTKSILFGGACEWQDLLEDQSEEEFLLQSAIRGHYPNIEIQEKVLDDGSHSFIKAIDFETKKEIR